MTKKLSLSKYAGFGPQPALKLHSLITSGITHTPKHGNSVFEN